MKSVMLETIFILVAFSGSSQSQESGILPKKILASKTLSG